MTSKQLPRLNLIGISSHIADLLLISDGSIESVREPRVRFAWHLVFFSTLVFILLKGVLTRIISDLMQQSESVSFGFRIFELSGWVWLLCSLFFLAFYHYRFLLLTKKDLRFHNIAIFFVSGVILFAYIYRSIYSLSPDMFVYSSPSVIPTNFVIPLSFDIGLEFKLDFILYSACISTSIDYPRIASASAMVSVVNVVQVIANFLIVALLVATFVQHARPSNDT